MRILLSLAVLSKSVSYSTSCTGTAEPTKPVPFCYNGSTDVLGFSTKALIQVNDFTAHKGHVDIFVSGVFQKYCKNLSFIHTSGTQTLNISIAKCIDTVNINAKYCSDQDKIALLVNISHLPIDPIHVSLNSSTCKHLL